ncbi:hypothetical protein PF010_g11997 [Phytophthora fragariae]|uniref:Uncharacterized protein n=2 Tax=Phytophthora fragariae TaxID=53985 RepID=A0A6G0MJR5_9STRA|nr:hypothetical protein PF010_g11997 [Phytophthora fragariae]KAE9170982.1 hypothetical protein PF004_g27704 [Phytophthora fragariae]
MSSPTTQTSDAPAASAAADTIYGIRRQFNCDDVKLPKRTISGGEYHKTRDKFVYARDTLFDGIDDVDMEEGEEEKESSSSGRDESSVGTRRPREDDLDASSSKRSRSGSDRPLADAGALSTPRGGDDDDSTPSAAVTTPTTPVRDP